MATFMRMHLKFEMELINNLYNKELCKLICTVCCGMDKE